MDTKELIRITNLSLGYNRIYPLEHVSFCIAEHTITGILGLHDSGLSTLLKVFSDAPAPTSGLYFYKQTPCSLSDIKNRVYFVRKVSSLTPNQTILENIFYISEKRPFHFWAYEKRCNSMLRDLLKNLNLVLDIKKLCVDLTDQERIIVECLKAILLNKELIIFEDIFPALSNDNLDTLHEFLIKISKSRRLLTIILTANRPHSIQLLADYMIFMAKGHCIYETPNILTLNQYESILSGDTDHTVHNTSVPTTAAHTILFQFQTPKIQSIFKLYENEMTVVLDSFLILRNEIKRFLLSDAISGDKCFIRSKLVKHPENSYFLTFNANEQIIENLSVIDNLILQKPKNFIKNYFIDQKRLQALKEDFCDWCRQRDINYDFINSTNCYSLTDFEKMSVYLFKYSFVKKDILFITDPLIYFDMDMISLVFGEIEVWRQAGTTVCIFVSEMRDSYTSASCFLTVDKHGLISENTITI